MPVPTIFTGRLSGYTWEVSKYKECELDSEAVTCTGGPVQWSQTEHVMFGTGPGEVAFRKTGRKKHSREDRTRTGVDR